MAIPAGPAADFVIPEPDQLLASFKSLFHRPAPASYLCQVGQRRLKGRINDVIGQFPVVT